MALITSDLKISVQQNTPQTKLTEEGRLGEDIHSVYNRHGILQRDKDRKPDFKKKTNKKQAMNMIEQVPSK